MSKKVMNIWISISLFVLSLAAFPLWYGLGFNTESINIIPFLKFQDLGTGRAGPGAIS